MNIELGDKIKYLNKIYECKQIPKNEVICGFTINTNDAEGLYYLSHSGRETGSMCGTFETLQLLNETINRMINIHGENIIKL